MRLTRGIGAGPLRGLGLGLAALAAGGPLVAARLSGDGQLAAATQQAVSQALGQLALGGLALTIGANWVLRARRAPARAVRERWLRWTPALLAAAALGLALIYGIERQPLLNDTGIYLVMGRGILNGQPPYLNVFDHKTPLTGLVTALGLALGGLTGVRILNLILLAALAGVVSVWGAALWRDRRAGLLAGLALLTFGKLFEYTLSGPQPKLLFLLAGLAALWLAERRPFWAGAAGALAFLAWQPGIIFAAAAVGLPLARGRRGWRPAALTLAGGLLPVILIGIYLAATGALDAAWAQAFLFNLQFLRRVPTALLQRLPDLVNTAVRGYGRETFVFGLAALGLALTPRRNWKRPAWLAFLLLQAALLALALKDFQGADDYLPCLPFAALWAGGALARLTRVAVRPAPALLLAALALAGLAAAGALFAQPAITLAEQQARVAPLGSYPSILSIDAHEALFLLNRPNAWRYYNLPNGEADYAAAVEPGGLSGMLQRLEQNPPALALTADPEHLAASDPATQRILNWIAAHYRPAGALTGVGPDAQIWVRLP